MIASDVRVERPTLIAAMTCAYGSTAADGTWSIRDAYDVLEIGQVLLLARASMPEALPAQLAMVAAVTARLPVHSVRSEKQIDLQQFSTPASLALLAVRLANIRAGETVLEPSAGTGLLAVFAGRAGASLILNEIDPWRRAMLQTAFPKARLFGHDGELIDDLLPADIVPDVVLLNPPFSRSEGRGVDRVAGLRHLRAALSRLRTGGRCVVILPTRVDTDSPEWRTATAGAGVLARLELPATAYARHGTSQPVQMLLLRKGCDGTAEKIACATLGETLLACERAADLPEVQTRRVFPNPIKPRTALLGGIRRRPGDIAPAKAVRSVSGAAPVAYEIFEDAAPVGAPAGIGCGFAGYRPDQIAPMFLDAPANVALPKAFSAVFAAGPLAG